MRASYFGTYQNATRIYNPHPDPLEKGPPKRVDRQEQHLGEMVASSKKRVTWTFTLGESDTIHEIVLTHSVLSYKKVMSTLTTTVESDMFFKKNVLCRVFSTMEDKCIFHPR
jgi:hypothetical protein